MASNSTGGQSGGAAAQTGSRYEARVAGWYCVRMVAGAAAQPPLQLPTGTRLRFVRCQTEAPVDDVLVETDQNGLIFVQAKSGLRLGTGAGSAFRSVLDQFVRLWRACEERAGPGTWARPIDPHIDRLVVATTPNSDRVTVVLPQLLLRLRDDATATGLLAVSKSAEEREVAQRVEAVAESCWTAVAAS